MLRFLADESCDFAAVRALRAERFDVLSVAEIMSGAQDERVIELALRESRILLTEDKDFGQLVFAAGRESVGVVLIRFAAGARECGRPVQCASLIAPYRALRKISATSHHGWVTLPGFPKRASNAIQR